MRYYVFEVVIEREENRKGYYTYCPILPGCFSNGRTIEDAKRNVREAVQLHVQSLRAHQQPIPQHERLVHIEDKEVT